MNKLLTVVLLVATFIGVQMLHEGLKPFAWDDVAWVDDASAWKLGVAKKTAPLMFKVEDQNSYYLFQTVKLRSRLRDSTIRMAQLPYGSWYQY